MNIIDLPPNTPATFYRGSGKIAAFRGLAGDLGCPSEDWIASTTPQFGQTTIGLTMLADDRFLREAINEDPRWWLGQEPGDATVVPLVKFLDPGRRIPVHVHPDDAFAHTHLGTCNGKNEAWIVLDAEPGATVHIGWHQAMSVDDLAGLVERQDPEEMFAAMHEIPVRRGDTVFVPAGVPHSIGTGVLVLEVQQSADASVLIEWNGYGDGSADGCFLGLPRATALSCCELAASSREEVEARIVHGSFGTGPLLVEAASAYFAAHVVVGPATVSAGYSVVVGLEGSGAIRTGGSSVTFGAGSTKLVPAAAGEWSLEGPVTAAIFGPAR